MSFIKKWYIYQKERFPVLIYGTYIFAIVFATFCYNHYYAAILYRERFQYIKSSGVIFPPVINYVRLIPMFIVAFLQFLMVRIADEFKDYEEDCKYRPYRPVPRGLVTLKELKTLFMICIMLQLIITLRYGNIGLLLVVWLFFGVMSKNFFMKNFLDKHILIEVFFDELLMPIVVLFLSSFVYVIDYSNIGKLLFMSYIISWIVEIARKVRCKEDEEEGVKTYTAVFGIPKAIFILVVLETILMLVHTSILEKEHIILTVGCYIIVNIINLLFAMKQSKKLAKCTELSANLYVMIAYFSLGWLIF